MFRTIAPMAASIVLIAGFWLGACGPKPANDAQISQVQPALRHAVQSGRLKSVMVDLVDGVAEQWPQEIADLQAEEQKLDAFRKARKIAKLLAQSAEQIPQAVADIPMSDADRVAFLTIVDQLAQDATELSDAAAAQDLHRMQASLSKTKTTCYGCHVQFSQYAGPLQFDNGS